MNISTPTFQFGAISLAVISALLVFGVIYNRFVAQLETQGHDRGYMAFIGSAGVFITLLGAGIIIGVMTTFYTGLLAWIIMLACFFASGLPMIWGSVTRHTQQRQQADLTLQDMLKELPAWLHWMHSGEGEQDGQTEDRRIHIPSND